MYPGDRIVKGVPMVYKLRLIGRFPEIARENIALLQEAEEANTKIEPRVEARLSNAQLEALAELRAAFNEVLAIARSDE